MEKLVQGLHQFQQTYFDTNRALFERLVRSGQRPETLFITCSDSRINPNLLTQTRPGELFIIRLAGNLVPAHGASSGGEAATIEYAVASLGVKDIIVCGHSHCGAMHALLDDGVTEDLPLMRAWLSHAAATRRIIEENYADRDGEARVKAATEENVLVQLENLRTHPVVAARLARGELHLHGWVYKIESGEVFAYEPGTGQFLPLAPETVIAHPTVSA
ncbi:MAG: carbonic anhydrase [Candidatus Sericytochromatia bacterium]|nr:carbonic anhydrase [Candidatus Sericytochromatia bacterium]